MNGMPGENFDSPPIEEVKQPGYARKLSGTPKPVQNLFSKLWYADTITRGIIYKIVKVCYFAGSS